ncbi:phosphotransferase family protein [Sciscionella marina]|uniref:phosphotransferase family protein n=1 Tax=Sciscionella marina TaxID=508770 RepID=UPI00036D1CA9|nr:phosphotransferase family protein [Sciscionella marina]
MTATTTTPATETSRVAELLHAFLASQPDAAGRIVDLRRADTGRSRNNWLFDLVGDGSREPLILRTDPLGGLIDTNRSVEFAVLRSLESSPLPTPAARWLDPNGRALGRPSLIMSRLPGECDYRVLRNPARVLDERIGLARTFCELLASVHDVDWRGLGLSATLTDPGPEAARTQLNHWATVLRTDQVEPWPELEYAIAVLDERAPLSASTVLVHADFKPGNILLDGDRVSALLDWELAHLGDPLEDLGWVTQPLRTAEHTIPGSWDTADLIAHYERTIGTRVALDALDWWVAFSALKTAIMQVSGLRAFLAGRTEQPYRPTRRVLSTVLDAVLEDYT